MSDKDKFSSLPDQLPLENIEDLWIDKYIDLDARNLIDMQVAMTEPSAKKIRGKVFSP